MNAKNKNKNLQGMAEALREARKQTGAFQARLKQIEFSCRQDADDLDWANCKEAIAEARESFMNARTAWKAALKSAADENGRRFWGHAWNNGDDEEQLPPVSQAVASLSWDRLIHAIKTAGSNCPIECLARMELAGEALMESGGVGRCLAAVVAKDPWRVCVDVQGGDGSRVHTLRGGGHWTFQFAGDGVRGTAALPLPGDRALRITCVNDR